MALLRQLTAAADIDDYAAAYHRASGYRVSREYLRRSLVFGYLHRGRLVGGIVMSGQAPFRTLERIPDDCRAAVAAAIEHADTVELTCAWLHPSLRGRVRSIVFWFAVFAEMGRRGAASVLFGTESRGLCRMYALGRPHLLYEGPVTVDGVRRHGWIFHGPVRDRWAALARIALDKLQRRRGRTRPAAPPTTIVTAATPNNRGRAPGQAGVAAVVPLRGLTIAAVELARRIHARVSGAARRRAEAALAAAAIDGGWALVTGASSGIGRAYAERLARRGAALLLIADDDEVLGVADQLRRDHGVRVDAFAVDLATHEGIAAAASWVGERRVEVLVNNAGVGMKGRFVDADPLQYARMIGVNLLAPVLLTRALLPTMLARGRGVVIHVASVNALAPIPGSAVYSATKAFLLSYATAVWHEARNRGVVLQTVLPGTTATAFHEKQHTRLPLWALSPARVADSSLAALGTSPVHVPGLLNKVFRALGALLPLTARAAAASEVLTASLGHPSVREATDAC
jgi:short-subunit dehydrogenase